MKCAGSRLQNLISLSCDRPGSGGTMRPPPPFPRPRQTFAGRIMWSSFTHYGSETFLPSSRVFSNLRRKRVVWGNSVSVRVDIGGRRVIKKKKKYHIHKNK